MVLDENTVHLRESTIICYSHCYPGHDNKIAAGREIVRRWGSNGDDEGDGGNKIHLQLFTNCSDNC